MAARLGIVHYVLSLILAGLWVLGLGGLLVSSIMGETPTEWWDLVVGLAWLAGFTFIPAGIIWGIGWTILYVLAGGENDKGSPCFGTTAYKGKHLTTLSLQYWMQCDGVILGAG